MVVFGPTRLERGRLIGLPASGVVTSTLGARDIHAHAEGHSGVDVALPLGTPVRAPAPGVVAFVSKINGPSWWSPVWGASVVVEHADASYSLYAHLDRVAVPEGAPVARGDLLGWSGSSGRSTGPHLHWGHATPGNRWIRRAQGLLDPLVSIMAGVEEPVTSLLIEAVEAALEAIAEAVTVAVEEQITRLRAPG